MKQYQKIQTVYLRDPETKFKTLLDGQFAKPEFAQLKNMKWRATEKVDGTNIRVIWDGEKVEFRGKTDRAQIPPLLLEVLKEKITTEKLASVFGDDVNVCLYGEGYGYKIQSGKGYLSDSHDFILFDVVVNDWYLLFDDTVGIANKMGIKHVPEIGLLTLSEAVNLVKTGFESKISEDQNLISEGLILKPVQDMFNRKGERIITKIKHKDFNR